MKLKISITSFSTTMKSPSASSTSSSCPPKAYDIFISCRGDSGGEGDSKLTSELAKALSNIGLRSFTSGEGFIGDYQDCNLIIQNSRYLIVVLSEDYVTSMRCLREFSKIMEYEEEDHKEVIPVFYHDPSNLLEKLEIFENKLEAYEELRKEERSFNKCGCLMTELATRFKKTSSTKRGFLHTDLLLNLNLNDEEILVSEEDKQELLSVVLRCKSSLKEITKLPTRIFATEERHVSDIIDKVEGIINKVKECPNLVGISPQLHQIDTLLDLDSSDRRFIGIVGMGGIGKTTLAKSVLKNLEPKFGFIRCFLRVYDEGLVSIQRRLLSKLCGKLDTVIKNEDHGAQLVKNCLRNRRVLIVFDGVEERRQIKKLAGSLDWFSPGSRIIVTTRNRNICRQPKYKHKTFEYNVECLDRDSALSLFCKHAFGEDHEPPDENFRYLTEEIVKLVERHPLALIKIGSLLCGQQVTIWEVELERVHKLLYRYLFHDILEKSYERLDEDIQQVFLDLACFFNNGMSLDRLIEILEIFGYESPYNKLHLLADRNLIQISYEKIHMHTLVRCMGRGIARGERYQIWPRKLIRCEENGRNNQSRIWLPRDIRRVVREKKALKHVQGIVLMDMDMKEKELVLEAKSFSLMTKLKLLEISNNVKINEQIPFLSNQLRLLHWRGYPSKYLPSTFQPPSLLELHLRNSQVVRLWEQKKEFIRLKEIDVSGSEYLVETPDFSEVPNLQRLILRNCSRLHLVHPSIATLNHLVLVDMAGCVDLKIIPSNLITCKKLQTLILSCSGIECFPEIEKPTKSLTELHFDGTPIYDLPLSLGLLTHLTLLNLRDCTKLSSLPSSIRRLTSLQTLNLNGCKNLHQVPLSLGRIRSLTMLDIGGILIDQAPDAISSLRNLETLNCERLSRNIWCSLTALVGNGVLPLKDLNLSDCNLEDEDIPNDLKRISSLEILDLSKNAFVRLKESITQLTNLSALYLNDCINLQPQQLPKLPTSLQYVGGQNSSHMSQNVIEGSNGSKSVSSLSNPLKIITEIENVDDDEKEEHSQGGVGDINNLNDIGKQICQSSIAHSNIEVSCKDLVGMEEQLEEVRALLNIKQSNEVRFVWISGMGGIGKTSIAEVVYNEIVDKFHNSCFLHISKKKNLVSLQRLLLSGIQSKEDFKVQDENSGAQVIKNRMKSKRVLIVLDDIDEKRQVEVLVGSPHWFGLGSRVIITSRNKDVLHQLDYKDKIREYNVKLISQESAYLLFCKYAFRNHDNSDKNNELCMEIVKKVGNLPLALIMIGSALHNKSIPTWKQMLRILSNIEEEFFSTIANRRNQTNQTNSTMKLVENVQPNNQMVTFQKVKELTYKEDGHSRFTKVEESMYEEDAHHIFIDVEESMYKEDGHSRFTDVKESIYEEDGHSRFIDVEESTYEEDTHPISTNIKESMYEEDAYKEDDHSRSTDVEESMYEEDAHPISTHIKELEKKDRKSRSIVLSNSDEFGAITQRPKLKRIVTPNLKKLKGLEVGSRLKGKILKVGNKNSKLKESKRKVEEVEEVSRIHRHSRLKMPSAAKATTSLLNNKLFLKNIF